MGVGGGGCGGHASFSGSGEDPTRGNLSIFQHAKEEKQWS